MTISAEPFPLFWPDGWQRTELRKSSAYKVTLHAARLDVQRQLRLMRAHSTVISCNLALRRDGLPLSSKGQPADPGVAVYWVEDQLENDTLVERVIACDQWADVKSNTRACGLALDALRMLQRSGASQVIDRVLATMRTPLLAASNPQRSWREVFGWPEAYQPTHATLHAQFRALAKLRHPDQGGTHEATLELTHAYQQALAELGKNGATVQP